jgi:RHS repeat-associated protein
MRASAPHKFTGKERDAETGLDNFEARYMSSSLSRFMSPDEYKYVNPADPQTLNLYGYVANNPINSVDPTGHSPLCLTRRTWSKNTAATQQTKAEKVPAAGRVAQLLT